jgi:S1-C subfamily serine protease
MEVRTMKRVCSGAVVMTVFLGAVHVGAQAPAYRFPDPTVLVGVFAGVLISAVDLDSPASRGGLKAGDVITAAAGQMVRSPADVSSAMRGVRPGSKLELKVVRDRKELSMAVDLTTIVPTLL